MVYKSNLPNSHLENSCAKPSDLMCNHIWPSKANFRESWCPSLESVSGLPEISFFTDSVPFMDDVMHNSFSNIWDQNRCLISLATESAIVS